MVTMIKSGLVQRVTQEQRFELYQSDALGGESIGADIVNAQLDVDSPLAIPAVPTTEAPYDGQVCFGIMEYDANNDGP